MIFVTSITFAITVCLFNPICLSLFVLSFVLSPSPISLVPISTGTKTILLLVKDLLAAFFFSRRIVKDLHYSVFHMFLKWWNTLIVVYTLVLSSLRSKESNFWIISSSPSTPTSAVQISLTASLALPVIARYTAGACFSVVILEISNH